MGVSTFIILAVVFGFRAHRRHWGMPPPEPPPFDPSVCHCPVVLSVGPENAALYATRHLESTGRSLVQGVGILRCPVTDSPWLWFSQETPHLGVGVPCLVRVRPESIDPPEPDRPGVYL